METEEELRTAWCDQANLPEGKRLSLERTEKNSDRLEENKKQRRRRILGKVLCPKALRILSKFGLCN